MRARKAGACVAITLGLAGGMRAEAGGEGARTHGTGVAAVEAPADLAGAATHATGVAAVEAPAFVASSDTTAGRAVASRPLVDAPGLDPRVLDLALRARECARKGGAATERADSVLSVIDFSRPSSEPRLWVLDLASGTTLYNERVAHGRTTGDLDATRFSNVPGSNASSVGLYRTAETYVGKHGRSLRLDGLDPGWNDRARDRAIVVHGASYCTLDHVEKWGRLGRSQGCPALDPAVTDAVIDTIRGGTLLFAYYPDADWLAGSSWLACDAGAVADG